jgi:serine protease Do
VLAQACLSGFSYFAVRGIRTNRAPQPGILLRRPLLRDLVTENFWHMSCAPTMQQGAAKNHRRQKLRPVIKFLGRPQLLAVVVLYGVLLGAIQAASYILIAKPSGMSISSHRPLRGVVLPDFVALAQEFAPSLVHISTLHPRTGHDPLALGETPPDDGQAGLGSGILIDEIGHLITNHHVIQHGGKMIVKLADRREFEATIVGRDARSDIALLKIAPASTAPLGDSSRVQTGEWVAAMGSPFGLDSTLTAGIVSAKKRRIPTSVYYDFIQTDVSINPGNSGGPLLNLQGRVVGINTAMLSRNGASIGINFAIPINLIKDLLPELFAKGRVTRGWLGISTQIVSPEIARLLKVDSSAGALIVGVDPVGPAAHAGIHPGDIVVEYNGKWVNDAAELPALVAKTTVGRQVALTINRRRMLYQVMIPVGELKESENGIATTAGMPGNTGLQPELTPREIIKDAPAPHSRVRTPAGGAVKQAFPSRFSGNAVQSNPFF